MMKQRTSIFSLLLGILLSTNGYAQKGIMRLTQQTLMHGRISSRTSVLYWTELKKRTTNPK